MRLFLLLFVIPALICAGFAGTSTKEESARSGATTTESPPPEPIAQASSKSCLWYRGKIKWCLNGWEGDEWSIYEYEGRDHAGRYYVHNHRGEVLGYLRPTSYGWRAMNHGCWHTNKQRTIFRDDYFPGSTDVYCGWARGGRVVRAPRNAYYVYSDRGRRREVARGPDAIAVAAHKLVIGDCARFCG